MSDIPFDVLRGILLRLPAQSLFRFKTVCKEWRRLIDDPSFVRSLALTNQESSSTTLCITTPPRASVYYLPLHSLEHTDGLQTIGVIRVRTSMRSLPVASCNGLKLISYYDSEEKYTHELWNPLTREFHKLPRPSSISDEILRSSGFGYDYASDDYKVVRIDSVPREAGIYVYETRVYSLRSSSWKMIRNYPGDVYERTAVYVNGSLHWRSEGKIIALDLRTEDYQELPEPPLQGGESITRTRLDGLCGSLVFSCFSSRDCYEGWLMTDCGSWMKLFCFRDIHMNVGAARNIRPIAYLKSKGQIILQEGCCTGCKENVLHWLDIEKNTWKKFTIQGLPKFVNCHICPGSLFRLDQTLHLERKNVGRLKCFVTVTDTCFHSDSDSSYSSDSEFLIIRRRISTPSVPG